jgi:hypothetical protein
MSPSLAAPARCFRVPYYVRACSVYHIEQVILPQAQKLLDAESAKAKPDLDALDKLKQVWPDRVTCVFTYCSNEPVDTAT